MTLIEHDLSFLFFTSALLLLFVLIFGFWVFLVFLSFLVFDGFWWLLMVFDGF